MYCRNCGHEVDEKAIACTSCGVAPLNGKAFCQNCGAETNPQAIMCTKCGVQLGKGAAAGRRSKMVAGILGILLGGLGIHRFYLGYTTIGLVMLISQIVGQIIAIVTCGVGYIIPAGIEIWGLIEGIMILVGTMNEDADGNPLSD